MSVVHLLLNPAARSKRRVEADTAIRNSLRAHGQEVVELRPDSIDTIASTVTAVRRGGVTRLVIAGGDGLLHHALPAIAGSDIAVGIVPIGTGNDFARALGLPTDVDQAVEAALTEPVPLDLIAAGDGRWAASVVTGGFSGEVNARANRLRFPRGQQRYTVATLLELYRLSTVELTLTVDGECRRLDSALFAVANCRYFGGGMAICPDASPDDGLLDVTVVGDTSRYELARVLPTVFSGRHVEHPSVTTFRGRHVEITAAADLWADGEPLGPTPTTNKTTTTTTTNPRTTSFTAAPGALRVAGSLVGT